MEIPLKYKYRCQRTRGRYAGGPNGADPKKRTKKGPKTYQYGSRVMVLLPSGKRVMMPGEPR